MNFLENRTNCLCTFFSKKKITFHDITMNKNIENGLLQQFVMINVE